MRVARCVCAGRSLAPQLTFSLCCHARPGPGCRAQSSWLASRPACTWCRSTQARSRAWSRARLRRAARTQRTPGAAALHRAARAPGARPDQLLTLGGRGRAAALRGGRRRRGGPAAGSRARPPGRPRTRRPDRAPAGERRLAGRVHGPAHGRAGLEGAPGRRAGGAACRAAALRAGQHTGLL